MSGNILENAEYCLEIGNFFFQTIFSGSDQVAEYAK